MDGLWTRAIRSTVVGGDSLSGVSRRSFKNIAKLSNGAYSGFTPALRASLLSCCAP
jgi:hypothetical protein